MGPSEGRYPPSHLPPGLAVPREGRRRTAGSRSGWLYLAGERLVGEAVRALRHVRALTPTPLTVQNKSPVTAEADTQPLLTKAPRPAIMAARLAATLRGGQMPSQALWAFSSTGGRRVGASLKTCLE